MNDHDLVEIDGPIDGITGVEGVAYVYAAGHPSWGCIHDGDSPGSVCVELPKGATVVGWRCSREVQGNGRIVDVPYYVDLNGMPMWVD